MRHSAYMRMRATFPCYRYVRWRFACFRIGHKANLRFAFVEAGHEVTWYFACFLTGHRIMSRKISAAGIRSKLSMNRVNMMGPQR